jgi:hypothetical protein
LANIFCEIFLGPGGPAALPFFQAPLSRDVGKKDLSDEKIARRKSEGQDGQAREHPETPLR